MKSREQSTLGWHRASDDLASPGWHSVQSTGPKPTYHVLGIDRAEADWALAGSTDKRLAAAYLLGSRVLAHPIMELPDEEERTEYQIALPTKGRFPTMSLGVLYEGSNHFVPQDIEVHGQDVPSQDLEARFPSAIVLDSPFSN